MARCVWTFALCFLTTATTVAQSPGDEGPGNNVGRAARRAAQPAAEPASEPEEEMEDEPAEGERARRRGRDEDSEGRPGRGEPGSDRGRFGGGLRRGNPIFEALDADSDGSISTAELRRAAVALKTLDADSDGKITLAEASPPGGPAGPGGPFGGGDPTQMVDGMIRQMDRNRDGRIGMDEVDERSLRMLSNIRDVNGDGALDRAELLAGMEQMQQRFGGGGPAGGFGGGGGFDGARMTERMMANDANGDGQLSADEVPEQFRGMLRDGDEDGDGFINARELEMATRRMGDRFRGGVGGDREGRGERGARRGGGEDENEDDEAGDRRSRRQRPETEG